MNIKSANGVSSVKLPTMSMSPNAQPTVVNAKSIVFKPLNTHRSQPGLKGKVGL